MGMGRRKAYDCAVLRAIDQRHVEVAMKYVLLGNLSPEWASKQSERIGKAKAKLDKLGIKVESIHYTQGYYDFVDIVDAPNEGAMLAFSVWYATQGLGRIQSMPAFDAKTFETAIKDAAG
ncbi:GYD domain-containing protein [Bradyrhizobium paxllaeri]|uniref:GYD domain-containing protein n=1 Tax=Bradyrhizobium paxllaeri TaxID=190148 RepID=UPI001FE523E5|nr:GYD domain-containing protein [Bradyrhizobium paxllaeri]